MNILCVTGASIEIASCGCAVLFWLHVHVAFACTLVFE